MGEQHAVDRGQTVGEAGEAGALRAILARLAPADAARVGPGDDAAVLRTRGDLVVTTDTMIEGPDFRLAWHTGFELGWKLAATNLSDVAAMGAQPIALTVALACPRDTPVTLLEEIARGLTAACASLAPGCGVVGGDLGRAPVLTAAVTALGEMQGRTSVLRSGARAGDVVAYAGELGLSGLALGRLFGLAAEPGPARARAVAELRERHPAALAAHLAPTPPIHLGIAAAEAGATAMLDVSDGLSLDASRLARASAVTLALDAERLHEAFGQQGGETVPLEAMLTGGEDHGLLATFPPGATLPGGFHAIGRVVDPVPETPLLVGGSPFAARGWDPYAVPESR